MAKSIFEFDKELVDDIIFGVGVNSENRFETFVNHAHRFSVMEFYYGFRVAYEGSDNLYQWRNVVKDMLIDIREDIDSAREGMMDEEELKMFNELPETVTVYRGMSEVEFASKQFGASWTLKREVAEFFANKYMRNYATNHLKKVVHSIEINKEDIIALLNDREELEVLIVI